MSFSRAKRFVYKAPDVSSSPADYLLSLDLEKGCSMLKCSRFQKPKSGDDDPLICSRMSNTYCSRCENVENECCIKQNVDDEKLTKFNRNDNMRKSIKARRKIDRNNTNKQCENNGMEKSLYEIEEFIDDDYGNMTSSKELDDLKNIEEYEFNKIYDAIRRIQRKRSTIVKKDENLDFQDTVLKKLDTIDKNVNVIKEDIACLQPKKFSKELESREYTISKNHCQFHSMKRNQELIRNIIARAIQKLGKNLENRRKSVQRDSQEHIVKIIAEMYENNNRSSKQIKELCNVAAEELVQNFSEVLETSTCECERENAWHGLKNKCFNDETLHNITIQNLIANYFEQTQEISQELEDFSDITIKCMDTQQMLDIQGVLLDEMRDEIVNLKCGLI